MSKQILKYLIYSSLYCVFVLLVLIGVLWLRNETNLLTSFDFLCWDAKHVYFIVQNGYDFTRCAFFPFFPYIWKFSHCSPFGISIINGIIFLFSFALLGNELKLDPYKYLINLGLPAFIFMFLPYSEAFLFLFIVLFYISLKRNLVVFTCIALLLMSVTKPTASIFVPAIFFAEYLAESKFSLTLKKIVLYSGVVILGNLIVFWVQYLATGSWFTFFSAQEAWGNKFSLPVFPLTTWNHPHVIWLDAVSLWVCAAAGITVFYLMWKRVASGIVFTRGLSYSVLYLAGTGLFVLFFRGGHLFSLNRFVMATPFVLIAIYELRKTFEVKKPLLLIIWLGMSFLMFSMFFGSYLHIRSIASYALIAILIGYWFYFQFNAHKTIPSLILLLLLVSIQVFYVIALLKGEWLA